MDNEVDNSDLNLTGGLEDAKPTHYNEMNNINAEQICTQCHIDTAHQYAHVKMDVLMKLKDSTRKLICLLEEIQTKTHAKNFDVYENRLTEIIEPIPNTNSHLSDHIGAKALKQLESQAKQLDAIYVEEEEDDCSIYKRLTRKCNCLNQIEYNDFTIHFNEETNFFSSNSGEIIKNMRILKKFLYMGGDYRKHALMFLNEGLSEASYTEKVEITHGCSHADVCNIFEEFTIVTICISWPCKYEHFGDANTQALTAGFLHKLSQLEEGRRYLKFSSKITNDIKKVLRKKVSSLEFETLETLNATLNLMHPPIAQFSNVTYYCKPADEGFGKKTVCALVQHRMYMTLDEIFTHLDLLQNLSNNECGKDELTIFLPALLCLFKNLLIEYDNSEMNIIITNILNNVVSKNMIKSKELPKTVIVADTATEPILMKDNYNQIPPKKSPNKSKLTLGLAPNKFKKLSKRKGTEPPVFQRLLDRSRNLTQGTQDRRSRVIDRSRVIVVPMDK